MFTWALCNIKRNMFHVTNKLRIRGSPKASTLIIETILFINCYNLDHLILYCINPFCCEYPWRYEQKKISPWKSSTELQSRSLVPLNPSGLPPVEVKTLPNTFKDWPVPLLIVIFKQLKPLGRFWQIVTMVTVTFSVFCVIRWLSSLRWAVVGNIKQNVVENH